MKTLTEYVNTSKVCDLEKAYGDCLQELEQWEKYQLILTIATWLAAQSDPDEDPESDEETTYDWDSDVDGRHTELVNFARHNAAFELGGYVENALHILSGSELQDLANLLRAIAKYAAADGEEG